MAHRGRVRAVSDSGWFSDVVTVYTRDLKTTDPK